MQRLCSHSSCSCGNARLDAVVNKETGTCVDMDGDETDPISSECFPATEGEREDDLVWCFPCTHVYFREGIEMWLKVRRTCPACRSRVTELVPYGMSEVEYDAGRLTREAERAAERARVAEEERLRSIAALPFSRMEEENLREVCLDTKRSSNDIQQKSHGAADWCSRELERNRLSELPSDPVLRATYRICTAAAENIDIFRDVLDEYIRNVDVIRANEAICAADSPNYDPLDSTSASVVNWTATMRRRNADFESLAVVSAEYEPGDLDADGYENYIDIVESTGDPPRRYIPSLRELVAGIRDLDAALSAAGLPARPQGQTFLEFFRSVGRRDSGSRAHGGNRNWGPRASRGSSSSNLVYSLSADDIMRGRNGGGSGHAPPAAAGGGTRPARYDAGAAVRRREAEDEEDDRPTLYDAWVATQRQGGGGNAGPARYNAAEMMRRRGAGDGVR